MKKSFLLVCSSLVLLFASCSKKSDPVPDPVGELDVRAVNTVIGSTSQDLIVNGVVKVNGLAYGNASAYAKMTSGTSVLGFYNTGTTTPMNAGGQITLPIGVKVSVYLFKIGDGSLNATLFDDATANPTTGKAKVRFVHMNSFLLTSVSTSTPISIALDGSTGTLVPSIAFGNSSSYFEVDPGAKFNFAGTGIVAGAAFDGGIVANKIYTIWIDGSSATNLAGHVILQN